MASITLPQFKLCWLDDSGKEQARSLLCSYARTMQQQQLSDNDSGSDDGHISQEDDFFCFGNSQANDRQKLLIQLYLSDSCKEIARLKIYPCIMTLFLKYNTTLPSSAPVERLFSLGSQIYVPRRNRLTDEHFERQLLLRANKWLDNM